MTFDKSLINKTILITGCGLDNVCATCTMSCSKFVSNGTIIGYVDSLEPTGFNPEMNKVWVVPINDTTKNKIPTRRKWCRPCKDPEHVVEVIF